MNKNKKIVFGIVGIIVLVGAFYGGMIYGGNNVRASINIRSSTFGQNSAGGMMRETRNGTGQGGFTAGQIISKDTTSITVGVQGGGSKIVFIDNNTKVIKSVDGTITDLATGKEVSVTGTNNADRSVNAQSVQIRPASTTRP